ncbi:Actin cross-linking [Tolypocladium capitatum]|uniref:Cofilin n=1 Tax=Tolypocladium capitatum TaxID=45235 RepID=A0A2K3QMS3_9HYPO|nr:Actin cross-linking [Tolypocladium capitatum]
MMWCFSPPGSPPYLNTAQLRRPGYYLHHQEVPSLLRAATLPNSPVALWIPECITTYNELKLSKKFKYIIYKLSDDNKQIVVEEASPDKDWENFREKLINATAKSKTRLRREARLTGRQGAVGKGPRYAVYDFEYNLASGDGVRYAAPSSPLRVAITNPFPETSSPSLPGLLMMPASWCVNGACPCMSHRADVPSQQPKMIYASSKEALKRSLTGIATELQANDHDDIEYDSIIKTVSKGLAG